MYTTFAEVEEDVMNSWIKFDEMTPLIGADPSVYMATYYEVMLKDGTITQLCWWLNHWYQSTQDGNVLYWRPLQVPETHRCKCALVETHERPLSRSGRAD